MARMPGISLPIVLARAKLWSREFPENVLGEECSGNSGSFTRRPGNKDENIKKEKKNRSISNEL